MQETGKIDVKVSVIPNGLEKYMAFAINKNLIFIGSIQFMNMHWLRICQIMIFNTYLKNLVVNFQN